MPVKNKNTFKKRKSQPPIKNNKNPTSWSTHYKYIVIFLLFTFALLFYPGDSFYVSFFSKNQNIFKQQKQKSEFIAHPAPYLRNPKYLPEVTARGVYIIDLASKTPIFEKNIHKKLLPASTTKIITSLVAYNSFGLGEELDVKRVIDEGQTVGLVKNERLTFENLLYGILVHSGNDAAYVIADNFPGGYDAFITAMNKKAKDLKMENTHFTNPAGFDEPGHFSTAFDMALAGRALLENEELSKIVSTKSITISDVDFKYFHTLYSVNKLLGKIPGVGGLKTGYTKNAKENLITFYKRNGNNFLIVLLKSEDRFKDTEIIVDWIKQNIGFKDV